MRQMFHKRRIFYHPHTGVQKVIGWRDGRTRFISQMLLPKGDTNFQVAVTLCLYVCIISDRLTLFS